MDTRYCIMPEMPYCPTCQFGYVDTSCAETYDDLTDAPWLCTCTKEEYDKYMAEHRGNTNDEALIDDGNRCWECTHMKQMCVATNDDIRACRSCHKYSNFHEV